jgi:hypothetical protein
MGQSNVIGRVWVQSLQRTVMLSREDTTAVRTFLAPKAIRRLPTGHVRDAAQTLLETCPEYLSERQAFQKFV